MKKKKPKLKKSNIKKSKPKNQVKSSGAKHFDARPILTYNGIFHLIITNRNYGKTWAFKRRAFVRGLKRGKKTVWIRTFRKEASNCATTMYQSRDLQKFCGIEPWDPDKKTGNFKQVGSTYYVRRHGKWCWFLRVFALSDSNAVRSVDDVDTTDIIFDEFTTTTDKEKRYRGNKMTDLIDMFYSVKREHIVRCFCLGNKECIINPFYKCFKIRPPRADWQGIRAYKKGSIIIEQRNNLPEGRAAYDAKLEAMLEGTSYGNYIYKSQYKNQVNFMAHKYPHDAHMYVQLNIDGYELKIGVKNTYFYCAAGLDKTKAVYCNTMRNEYPHELLLVKSMKRYFIAFVDGLGTSRVRFDDQATYEALQPFIEWIGAI